MPAETSVGLTPHVSDDGTPFVKMVGLAEIAMSPNTARELAAKLIEMAAVTEYEAAIIRIHINKGIPIPVTNETTKQIRAEIGRHRVKQN